MKTSVVKKVIIGIAVGALVLMTIITVNNNNAIVEQFNEVLSSSPPSAGGISQELKIKFQQDRAKFQQERRLFQEARELRKTENTSESKRNFKEQKRKFLEAHKKFMAAKRSFKDAKQKAKWKAELANSSTPAAAPASSQTQEAVKAKWEASQANSSQKALTAKWKAELANSLTPAAAPSSSQTQEALEAKWEAAQAKSLTQAAAASATTTAVLKVKEGGTTSFSQVSRQIITQNETGPTPELIQVKTAPVSSATLTSAPTFVLGSQFTLFPQDVFGWSIITPQKDSRLIYVSSSDGDDAKARAYTEQEIADPYHPSSNVVAFKTINSALTLLRDGYPDWILLKKGDEWQIGSAMSLRSGRSSSAPLVITSYGSSTKRPLINTGTQTGIKLTKGRSYIAVMGIEFYANHRDPNSSSFMGWDNVGSPVGLSSVTGSEAVESIYLEDNVFNFYGINVKFDGWSKHENIIIRRNQFLNAYSTQSHSQGMFTNRASLLIEDNLFDHNGWYQQNYEKLNSKSKGQATYFNHNAYLANAEDTVIQNNIFSRSSSIGLKLTANSDKNSGVNSVMARNIKIKNNLFVEGEIGISAGGNTDFNNGYRWKDMSINDNVMLHVGNAQPTRRTLAFHIDANDRDGGTISGNYLLFNDNSGTVTNVFGIQISGLSRNIDVKNNVLQGIGGRAEKMIYAAGNETIKNVNITQNDVNIDLAKKGARRDLLTYFNLSTSTAGNGVDALVERAKTQSKGSWNNDYLASEINKYLTK